MYPSLRKYVSAVTILYVLYLVTLTTLIHANNKMKPTKLTTTQQPNLKSKASVLGYETTSSPMIADDRMKSLKKLIITNTSLSSSSVVIPDIMKQKPKFSPWSLPILKRSDRRNIKLVFLLSLIAIETTSEIFVRLPQEVVYGSQPAFITNKIETESVVLIFPGAGGPDKLTDRLANSIKYSDRKHGIKRYVSVYDWSNWRGNFIRAAFDSQTVGKRICGQLARDSYYTAENTRSNENRLGTPSSASVLAPIKNLHAIGISVGAFAADSCIKTYQQEISKLQELKSDKSPFSSVQNLLPVPINASPILNEKSNIPIVKSTFNVPYPLLKANQKNAAIIALDNSVNVGGAIRPITRLTLLDPFTSKGVFGYGWGVKNFGQSGADLVEDYLNTDDPVPTTNDAVNAAYTLDITHSKDKQNFKPDEGESYHSWPVAYLADHWITRVNKKGELELPSATEEPKGVTYIVP